METSFRTHDLYLASALKIHGFRLIDIQQASGRGIFIFEDRSDRTKMVHSFFNGELTGSLKNFINAWSDLKGLLVEMGMDRKNGRASDGHRTR
jgi:hypothetical protein